MLINHRQFELFKPFVRIRKASSTKYHFKIETDSTSLLNMNTLKLKVLFVRKIVYKDIIKHDKVAFFAKKQGIFKFLVVIIELAKSYS
jgi:hypothetical protein